MTITTTAELERVLRALPEPEVAREPAVEEAIAASVRYLASGAALASIAADTYWPKWDSPWWHMLLLHELGEAQRIPARAVTAMVEGLAALPLKIFPIHPEDSPPGTDPYRDSSCHCALGCMHQVLSACGVDVARALPWVEPWFPRYQLADGGLSCDSDAYLVTDECPSSMVGTVAPFEAMAKIDPHAPFVARAARFLVARRLIDGSPTRHNAAERDAAPAWRQPCFPRFYFYDVVRGLAALADWADAAGEALPLDAIAGVVAHLAAAFPDGAIRIERRGYAGWTTMARVASGGERAGGMAGGGGSERARGEPPVWTRRQVATTFPLLELTSAIGRVSPELTAQWTRTRRMLARALADGRIR